VYNGPDIRAGDQCDILSERGLSWVNTDEDVEARSIGYKQDSGTRIPGASCDD